MKSNLKELKKVVNNAVTSCDDPILLQMVWQIFQDSDIIASKNEAERRRVGAVPYSDVLRQGQGCLPPGK